MVESTALEMRRAGNRTVGSNPTLSASQSTHSAPVEDTTLEIPEKPPLAPGKRFNCSLIEVYLAEEPSALYAAVSGGKDIDSVLLAVAR